MAAALRKEGRGLQRAIERKLLFLFRKLLHAHQQLHRAAGAHRGRHERIHGVIAVLKQSGAREKFRLRLRRFLQACGVGQKQLPALAQAVQLIFFVAVRAVQRDDGVHRFLAVAQAERRPIAREGFEALDGGKLPHHRIFHDDLTAEAVQRSAGFHHDGEIVQAVNAQPAEDTGPERHIVQETAFVVEIILLGLKIGRG